MGKEKEIPKRSGLFEWVFVVVVYNIYIYYVAVPTMPPKLGWTVPEVYLYLNLLGLGFNWILDEIVYWYKTNR